MSVQRVAMSEVRIERIPLSEDCLAFMGGTGIERVTSSFPCAVLTLELVYHSLLFYLFLVDFYEGFSPPFFFP